jgi:hypothetical protein
MAQEATRTEMLLELIANELLRLRMQIGPEGVEGHIAFPPGYAESFAEKIDEQIIGLRTRLGMPNSPFKD